MSNFNLAFENVLKNEGGFTNDPQDSGGATNWGITIHDLSVYLRRSASVEEVRRMSKLTARAIYKSKYWDSLSLDAVNDDGVALVIFDQGVLRGIGTIARAVQRILGVVVDGHFGPKTLAAINAADPGWLITKIEQQAEEAYREIVRRSPKNQKFLKGWINRAKRLLNWIKK